MTIGFIGLGVMGRPMARNLVKAGHDVIVDERHPEVTRAFVDAGASSAASPAEIASRVDVVLTMLPDSPDVRQVALGPDGILEGAHPGLVHIDMSSIAPDAAREVARELAVHGVTMIDAPVSGGEPGAVAGTLSFMVGGPERVVEQQRDLLLTMGASVVRVGDVGAGSVAKLANQAIVATHLGALAEAIVFARAAGVDPEAVVAAIRGGLAGSRVLDAKAAMMLEHDFRPGFRIGLHRKDLANALATAHAVRVPMPLAAGAAQLLAAVAAHGGSDLDHSGVIRAVEQAAGSD